MMELSETQTMPKARVQIAHPALALAGLMIGAFVGMFSETALNIALPSLMVALHVGTGTLQWLITGYMLVIGICMPLSSLLTKWFSTKKIVLFALTAFLVGAVTSALAGGFAQLLVGRMIQGIGTGLILPLMFSVAMQIFPANKLGTVMGMSSLVIMFAPAVGPTVTGLVLAKFSWQMIFWMFVPFLLIAISFAAGAMENVYKQTKTPVDWLSIVLSTLGFGGIVIGVSFATDYGWLSARVLIALAIGILALAAYAYRQLHMDQPMLNLRVFKTQRFTVGTLLVMLDFGLILASMYLLPQFLQRVMGLPVALCGLVMLPAGIVNALVSAAAGRLYDIFGAKWLTRLGLFIAILAVALLMSMNAATPLALVITAHVTLMIGAPLAMSPAQTYGLNSLSGAESADGSAILNTLQQIIGAVSTGIATSMITWGAAQGAGKAGLAIGSRAGFGYALILAAAAFALSWLVKKPAASKEFSKAEQNR